MTTYCEEKRRRIDQFAQCLCLMGLRRHRVVKNDDCFVIFDEQAPEDADSPKIREAAAIKVDYLADGGSTGDTGDGNESPAEDWRGADSPPRYIQLAFQRDCFFLDLPNNTLFPNETDIILQRRLGFYWARNRQDLSRVRKNWKDIVTWDPLQKIYLYRDEQSAAEDMAFILFDAWKFPVDWPWNITAAAFHFPHRFEPGKRLD
jgi:hypothetical protein